MGFRTSTPISINSGMMRRDHTVGVIGDLHVRIDGLQLGNEIRHARLKELAPAVG